MHGITYGTKWERERERVDIKEMREEKNNNLGSLLLEWEKTSLILLVLHGVKAVRNTRGTGCRCVDIQ